MDIELIKRMMDACYQGKRIRDMLPPLPDGVASSYIQYLDAIGKLEAQGLPVKVSDLSREMNLPRPGVTRTVKEMEAKGTKVLAGEDAFKLYDTHGFPIDLTKEILSEKGYDIDEESLNIARENAEKAGVADRITFEHRDIRNFVHDTERGTVITNPPYGERLLDIDRARELYKIMGKKFVKKDGWSYTIISPDDEFEKIFGRKADKRRKLYNGMLKCQAYMYFKR